MRCAECGYWNDPRDARCSRCGRRLSGPSAGAKTRRELEKSQGLPNAPEPAPPKPPPEPAWKQELQQRLAGYREKQQRRSGGDTDRNRLPAQGDGKDDAEGSWIDLPASQRSDKAGLPPPRSSRIPPPPPSLKQGLPKQPNRRHKADEARLPKPRADERKPKRAKTADTATDRPRALPASFERKKSHPLGESAAPAGAKSADGRRLPMEPRIAPRADDEYEAETKARSALEQRLAPLSMRFVAGLMDVAVVALGLGLFLGVAYLIDPASLAADNALLLMAAAFCGILGFYWIFFLRFLGRTAGMISMGLRVLNFDCRPPDEAQRRNRAFGTILSAAAVGIGFLWALADEQKLTWHDRMSKTFVALEPDAKE